MLAARLVPASRFLPSSVVEELAQRLDAANDQHEVVLAIQCEHRIDEIVPRALLAQLHFQTVGEEREQVRRQLLSINKRSRRSGRAQFLERRFNQTRQPRAKLVIENQPDNAQRRPAQRIRVLAAGRLLVDRPEADQRVDLVGERDRDRHWIGRHEIIRALRPVVILAGVGDGFVLALRLGVVLPHQALQLGEFADDFGQEVGLAQPRGALSLGDIGVDDPGDVTRQRLNPRDALGLRAELLVEHDLLEFRQPVFEPRLQVGLVEEFRIREPRADHALVAGDDFSRRRPRPPRSTPG